MKEKVEPELCYCGTGVPPTETKYNETIELGCWNCGRSVSGTSITEAIIMWNFAMKGMARHEE